MWHKNLHSLYGQLHDLVRALAYIEINPSMNILITTAVVIGHFIQMRSLLSRIFSALCEKLCAGHSALQFNKSSWLLRVTIMQRVELREAISKCFLHQSWIMEQKYKATNVGKCKMNVLKPTRLKRNMWTLFLIPLKIIYPWWPINLIIEYIEIQFGYKSLFEF